MPNCDWGKPCECKECRTKSFDVKCPKCNFNNSLEVEADFWEYSIDKNNLGDYNFSYPQTKKDLVCYACSYLIIDVPFFNNYNKSRCENRLKLIENIKQGRFCNCCNVVEGDIKGCFSKIELLKHDNNLYCKACLADFLLKENPDPSNSQEKYEFDKVELKWKKNKIKVQCPKCNKNRWLKAEHSWRKMCKNCYFLSKS
ncbi:hypothetical protein ACVA6F_08840 [Bacillus altitudinis]